jgi:hypothetical protein
MSLLRRIWNIMRRKRLDEDLRQELDAHLALLEEEERDRGLSADRAFRAPGPDSEIHFPIGSAHWMR